MFKPSKDRVLALRTARRLAKVIPLHGVAAVAVSEVPSESDVVIGSAVRIDSEGQVWVEVALAGSVAYSLRCWATLQLSESDLGTPLVVLRTLGGSGVVLGRHVPAAPRQTPPVQELEVTVDGRRIVITAVEELVLCCGEASITLRQNGRVLIKGKHVESNSEGVNRIKGGSVQIN